VILCFAVVGATGGVQLSCCYHFHGSIRLPLCDVVAFACCVKPGMCRRRAGFCVSCCIAVANSSCCYLVAREIVCQWPPYSRFLVQHLVATYALSAITVSAWVFRRHELQTQVSVACSAHYHCPGNVPLFAATYWPNNYMHVKFVHVATFAWLVLAAGPSSWVFHFVFCSASWQLHVCSTSTNSMALLLQPCRSTAVMITSGGLKTTCQ
jgi:hypothetical protein